MGRSRALGPLAAAALALAIAPPAGAVIAPDTPIVASPTVLISLEVTGGFAGIDSFLAVGSNGASRLDTRRATTLFRVGARDMRRLRRAVRAAHWLRLHSEYPARAAVADGYRYSLLHRGHVVRTETGARSPARLRRVLDLLERFAQRHGGFG